MHSLPAAPLEIPAKRRALITRLRAAGCVFAEDEADILLESTGEDPARLDQLVRAREGGAPLEPLVGWVEFAGLRLSVGPGVFVPRQRSLHLLDLALAELHRDPSRALTVVEAFAGVAPLAVAVQAARPEARVLACDSDPVALDHAARNLAERGTVHRANVLDGLPTSCRRTVDLIAAVPPYVPDRDMALLPREAREHEPAAALQGRADGLHWIRALIEEAPAWIAPGGLLLVELSQRQRDAAARDGRAHGWRQEQVEPAEDSLTAVLALRAAPDGA